MSTIVTRSGKGSPLTNTEVDANFTNLNTDKLELSGGTLTGNLSLGDNVKAQFGASNDLQIYHDGTHSYVDDSSGTGRLILKTDYLEVQNAAGNEAILGGIQNGAVSLFYDGNTKLATTTTGIDVTGSVTADGLTVNGGGNRSYFNLSHPRLSDGYKLEWGGGTNYIIGSNASNYVKIATNSTEALTINSSQNVNIPNGSLMVGATTAPARKLDVNGGAIVRGFLTLYGTGTNNALFLNNTSYEWAAYTNASNNFVIADWNAAQTRLTIDTSGNASFSGAVTSTGQINAGTNLAAGTSVYSGNGVYYGSTTLALKNNTSGNFLSFAANANATFSGSVTSTGLTVNATGSSYPTISHSNGNRIQLQPSYNYYNAYSHIFSSLNGTTNHLTIANTGNVNIPNGSLMVGATTAPQAKINVYTDAGRDFRVDHGTANRTILSTDRGMIVKSGGGYSLDLDTGSTSGSIRFLDNGVAHSVFDSSGNLGIGTSSPSNPLEIQHGTVGTGNGANNTLALRYNSSTLYGQHYMDANGIYHILADNSGAAGGNMQLDADTTIRLTTNNTERMRIDSSGTLTTPSGVDFNIMSASGMTLGSTTSITVFKTNNQEAARIDASQNLLVGTTSTPSGSTDGTVIFASGTIASYRTGAAPAVFSRNASNGGEVVVIQQQGTTVGSIGTTGGKLEIDGPSNNSGLRFHESSLIPRKNSDVTNGQVDLGYNDGSTILGFRNLTLSGGVYLGGTGAANKLDDYEEGTWSPTFSEQTAGTGTYTKIGRTVQVSGLVVCDANGGGVNPLVLAGLPFSVSSDTYRIHLGLDSMNASATGNNVPTPFDGMMIMQHDQYVRPSGTGSNPYFRANLFKIGTRVYISGQFETTA